MKALALTLVFLIVSAKGDDATNDTLADILQRLERAEEILSKHSIDMIEITLEQSEIHDAVAANTNDILANSNGILANADDISANRGLIEDNSAQLIAVSGAVYNVAPPVGSIMAWTPKAGKHSQVLDDLPVDWQLCDGSEILYGPWRGHATPDLRNKFLRGGDLAKVLSFEDSMIKDHEHLDNGHKHTDSGHTHTYRDYQLSHLGTGNGATVYDGWPNTYGSDYYDRTSQESTASLSTNRSGLKGVNATTALTGGETRPENMRVIFIMRIA